MQTWLALPDGREEIEPAFDHVPAERPAAGRGRRRPGARADGHACGARPPATPQHSPTIYADIELDAGGAIPIEADADERAVMLVGGEAELDGQPLDPFALIRPAARP